MQFLYLHIYVYRGILVYCLVVVSYLDRVEYTQYRLDSNRYIFISLFIIYNSPLCCKSCTLQKKLNIMFSPPAPYHTAGTLEKDELQQGTNARKVISEVYAFFVLQSTVFGRKSKHMSLSDMESIFTQIFYEIFWSQETIICEFSKLSKLNAFNLLGY